jgi:hypothetical protein
VGRIFLIIAAAILLFTIPWIANAAVVINEVAWMGGFASASDEWLELYNDGADSISLAGWKLAAEDGAPLISLSGSIPAGGFYIMERTDDDSAPGVTADKIYTGDLANVGETLKLLDSDMVIVDTVIGGSNWEAIGGNNTTKDTPQRQLDLSAQAGATWLTGIPTPKAMNATTSTDTGTVAGTSTTSTVKKSVTTGGYKQVVFAYAGEDLSTIAGGDVLFEGYAVTDKNVRISNARYQWSFGDGSKGKGEERLHTYYEPGTYVGVLTVYGDHQKHKDKVIVTVLPADVRVKTISMGEKGYIEIENRSLSDVDLSRWHLFVDYARGKKSRERFTIPEDTIIMASSSVRFSNRVTRLTPGPDDVVILQFPSGLPTEALAEEGAGVIEEIESATSSVEVI